MEARLARLVNPVRPYAWGSTRAIAELQGRTAPTSLPEAELWLGAHDAAPSVALLAGRRVPLNAAIAADPVGWLGREILDRFGPQLPFMMKVLAAERPLSLQVHPDALQAQAGFDAEEAGAVPVGAAHRNYRDPWPKPELLRALTPFTAFCGFRDTRRSGELFTALAVPRLSWVVDALGSGEEALRPVVRRLLSLPPSERGAVVTAVGRACVSIAAAGGTWAEEAAWGRRLAEQYPADPGVVVALLLELIRLDPGEAVHLPPGQLHAYMSGVAIEVMASSDNVLRGGLTAKHVDAGELLRVMDGRRSPVARIDPVRAGIEAVYEVEEPYFRLSQIDLRPGRPVELGGRGPQLLLLTDGVAAVLADGLTEQLRSGDGAVVPAAQGFTTITGTGTLFRATVGEAVSSTAERSARPPSERQLL